MPAAHARRVLSVLSVLSSTVEYCRVLSVLSVLSSTVEYCRVLSRLVITTAI